ncbi:MULTISPECIES: AAA family ATPase [Kamptonema]|uniref:nSTAND1 domain-containing NTPase n=1 Tax=Kamptonema TaxID=1501433 RepID=UPI0001DACBE2|nr:MULTISPECIES: AAA family ATPase [Kamptonema]CBN54496.1 putative WD-40 repeat protein [Kamptonema sp. PCC 6506]
MGQSTPDRQFQEQENLIKDTNVRGDLTFAPVQNIIETQIIQSSIEAVTQRKLNKNSPYQGLKRFNFKDRDRFFGRDKLIARLFEAVNRSNLSLVLGASGSGKSSVVRAGLVPELKKSLEYQIFYDFIFTPNQDPFDSLYRCLLSEEKDYNFSKLESEIALEAKADTLTKVISTLKKRDERWLIFVDQFEQLFTSDQDAEKCQNFIAGIVKTANSGDSCVKIIVAIRADFLEQLSYYPDLGEIANQNNIHIVTEMSPEQLRQAIEQPAAKHGVVFEAGLVEQIIKEVEGQKGFLPLLQYTLNLLWQSECETISADGRLNIEERTLTKKSYEKLEGVRGALQKHINDIYKNLNEEEKTATKQIFLRLVNIIETDSGSKTVSRQAYQHEFVGESVKNTIKKFIEANLLVSSSENLSSKLLISNPSPLKQSATVEIAHEVLLLSWDVLKGWIEQEKEAIILRNWLAGEARRWQKICLENASQANDELLKGSRLDHVVEFRSNDAFKNVGGLQEQENQFIDASVALRDREKQEKQEMERRIKLEQRIIAGVIGGAVCAVLGFSVFALWQRQQIEINTFTQFAEQLLLIKPKQLDGLIESLRATKKLKQAFFPASDSQMRVVTTLRQAVYDVREFNRLEKHQDDVRSVSFSPDGQILTSSRDKTIKLWTKEGYLLKEFKKEHSDTILSASFSPNGKIIASGSANGIIKLWQKDGVNLSSLKTIKGHSAPIRALKFTPNGQIIASSSEDETIRFWSLDGKLLKTIPAKQVNQGWVLSMSFKDNKTLATGGGNNTVKFWRSNDGKFKNVELLGTLKEYDRKPTGDGRAVWSIDFSHDGTMLATGGRDGTIKLWRKESKSIDWIKDLNFKLEEKEVKRICENGVKEKRNGVAISCLKKSEDFVRGVSFSPDNQVIAAATWDKKIILWYWNKPVTTPETLNGHEKGLWGVSFSPDGKIIASASKDNTVKLWNKQEASQAFGGGEQSIWDISFNPDSQIIASASESKVVKQRAINGNSLCKDLVDPNLNKALDSKCESPKFSHNEKVKGVAFSPDGKIIASASWDCTVKLWHSDGRLIKTLTDHSIQSKEKNCSNQSSHSKYVQGVAFSPDGQMIASASSDKEIKLWSKDGNLQHTLKGHNDSVYRVRFSPDGKTLASASADKTVKLWSKNGELLNTLDGLEGHKNSVTDVNFSLDGKIIASASADQTIKLWNKKGKLLKNLYGHSGEVQSISFSRDGQMIASGSKDHTIKIWNRDGILLNTINVEVGPIYSVSFSPDQKYLAAGSDDGRLRLWKMDLEGLQKEGCDIVRDYLKNNPNVSDRDRLLCEGIDPKK